MVIKDDPQLNAQKEALQLVLSRIDKEIELLLEDSSSRMFFDCCFPVAQC